MSFFRQKYPNFDLFSIRFDPLFVEQQQDFFRKLPPPMQSQAQGFFRTEDKWAYLAGKFLLTKALLPYAEKENFWDNIGYNAYGKPYFFSKNVHFNLSHSGNYVVLALCPDRAVGIDIEHIRPINYPDFEACFSPKDWQKITQNSSILPVFYRYWTWKESIIKADGRGLSVDLLDVIVGQPYSRIADTPEILYQSDFPALDPDYALCVSFANFA